MTLKPQDLGVTGKFSNLSSYKTKVITSIAKKRKEFDSIDSRYAEYLEWLVNNANASSSLAFSELGELRDKLKLTTPKNSWDELNVYFIEVLGPIYIIEQLNLFSPFSAIDVPQSAIQGAYDFAVDGAQISVKRSGGGKTNTLKPGDIVDNKPFGDFISRLPANDTKKLIYQIFEVLNEKSSLDGPWTLIYGTTGNNGLLKSLKPSVPATTSVKENQNILLDPSYNKVKGVSATAKEMFANDIEADINGWSKTPAISNAMKEFTGDYLLYSGLGLFTISISDKNGRATAKYSTTPTGSSLAGKGRASFRYGRNGELKMPKGEKMGISMKF